MILKICWHEPGNVRDERCTQTELPDKPWDELQENIRQLVMKAVKYDTSVKVPEGLLKEGEQL